MTTGPQLQVIQTGGRVPRVRASAIGSHRTSEDQKHQVAVIIEVRDKRDGATIRRLSHGERDSDPSCLTPSSPLVRASKGIDPWEPNFEYLEACGEVHHRAWNENACIPLEPGTARRCRGGFASRG